MPAVLDPFGKSEIETKLDLLFHLARPGRCERPEESEPTTVSRVEESLEVLENRMEDRDQTGSPSSSALEKSW